MKCTTHPKYEAKHKPQCDCLTCWIMWEAKQSKNEVPAESQHGRDKYAHKPDCNPKPWENDCKCGALQKAREPDKVEWICLRCGHRNAANNEVCMGAEMGDGRCGKPKPEKVKPLAQYLTKYIEQEIGLHSYNPSCELLEQALDAYQSTENVKIRIEQA